MNRSESRPAAGLKVSPLYRCVFSNALGGSLHRGGRIDQAITRLNEGMDVAAESAEPPAPDG
jgi:hypothetical protein